MKITERTARMGLAALLPMGQPALVEMVRHHGAVDVWHGLRQAAVESTWSRRATAVDPEAILSATQAADLRFVIPGDAEWPSEQLLPLSYSRLRAQGGEPLGLWVRGSRLDTLVGGVAIVGSRASTQYGERVAQEMAADLATAGSTIISGLAYGIDAAAHRGALAAGRPTLAVLAGGADVPYPVTNSTLKTRVEACGAVISEAPPGTHPMKAAFLARNRLIAALSTGVVIVEAAARSGARNTVAWANEIGRVVMAVPGPVTSSMSQSPHYLIREGQAALVTNAHDVLQLVQPLAAQAELPLRGPDKAIDALAPQLREIREVVSAREEVSVDELAARTGKTIFECLTAAGELADLGWLEPRPGGLWALPSAVT